MREDSIGENDSQAAQLRLARQALAQLRESVVITEPELDLPGPRIVWVNAAFTRMTGYTAEEVIGLTPRILQGPKTRRETIDRLRRRLERGEPFTGEDINYRKDGSEFYIDWYIEPLRDAAGRITHFVAVQRDRTVERQLEAQFLQAQRLESIGMLASGVAHDLNNILAPVLIGAEFLSGRLTEQDDREMVALMQKGAARGAGLVKQILSFVRGIGGESTLAQVRHLIEDVVSLAQQTFPKRITTRSAAPHDLWPVLGDATQIHQVLMNLCVNARDAIEGSGSIRVEAENLELAEAQRTARGEAPPGRYVRIRVCDTGSGIPESAVEKIFQPFFTTKAPGKGTGLGLSTVLAIVKHHDGFLDFATALERGTTFTIYLPAAAQATSESGNGASSRELSGNGETLLVVDDEEAIVSIAREMLTAYGYRVLTAVSCAQAVRVFAEERPAVTLLDLIMGDNDGPATLQRLRAIDPTARVIAVSGLSKEEAAVMAPEADSFLAKPFTVVELLEAVSRLLRA